MIFYKGIAAWAGLAAFDGYFASLALASLIFPIALAGGFFNRQQGGQDVLPGDRP
jgi:hypothetical protein